VTDSQQTVLIVGYGEMGKAMEYLLEGRHRLSIWDRHPLEGRIPVRLEEAASAGSHHRMLGAELVRNGPAALSGEGIHALAMIRKHALVRVDDFPLYRLVQDMVDKPVDLKARIQSCLHSV